MKKLLLIIGVLVAITAVCQVPVIKPYKQNGQYVSDINFPITEYPTKVIVDSTNFWRPVAPIPPPIDEYDFVVDTEAELLQAASQAISGQTVAIKAGTYRVTIIPAKDGVTFINYHGERAIVSGLNKVTSPWMVHSGQIYKAAVTLPVNGYNPTAPNNTTLLANQLFKDGVMMFEARWPNINALSDLLDRNKVRSIHSRGGQGSTPSSTTIVDAGAPSNMVGASIWLNGWYVTIGAKITAHSGTTMTFAPSQGDVKKRKFYYLTNKLSLLDVEKEWHYENGTLYFYQPGGGSPSGTIEYKARNYGFDLSGRSGTIIQGIEFIGCTPAHGNTSTNNTVIDHIKATYMNHAVMSAVQAGEIMLTCYINAHNTGIKLIGRDNVIKNSDLSFAASQVIWLGENGRAENNLIHDIGYDGNFGCAVMPWGPKGEVGTGGQKILRNTVYRSGRSSFDGGYNIHGQHLNMEIAYNNMYDFCMLNTDAGALYIGHFINTTGLRTHHNWIHDNKGVLDDGTIAGIYYDQGSGNSTNDHNVIYRIFNSTPAIAVGSFDAHFCTPDYEDRNAGPSRIENCTFADINGPVQETHSYKTSTQVKDAFKNVIFRDDAICCGYSTTLPNISYSIKSNVDPMFIGTGEGGLAYRLAPGSPGINAGIHIPGITDGFVGNAPDIGAYEYGGVDWTAGHSEQVENVPVSVDNTSTTSAYEPSTWTHSANTDWLATFYNKSASYSELTDGSITTTFEGYKVEWWTEKRVNHGIALVSIDNGAPEQIDLYDPRTDNNTQLVWNSNNMKLKGGTHTITIKVSGQKNPLATAPTIIHDRFVIYK